MLSPVWTPIASRFSMVQTTTKLSAPSRITSSSYSFQPIRDSSISTVWTGLSFKPQATFSSNSDWVKTVPAPLPPMVKLGRIKMGKRPMAWAWRRASTRSWATKLWGDSRPTSVMASLKSARSSATCMERRLAPISSTPYFSNIPASARATERFNPVWPPTVGSKASGRSLAMMRSKMSTVNGSM